IDVTRTRLDHFIGGFDLEKAIVSYMSLLRQFNFHIDSILKNPAHIEIDTIRQSFMKHQQQSVDFAVDYFNNNYGSMSNLFASIYWQSS
ncbi:unnamed protein product, partial [Rotaria sordida]